MCEKWMDLKVSCPAFDCANQEITSWVHATDGYTMEISTRARVYKATSYDSFTKALNMAFKVSGDKQVMKELLQYLFDNEW
ncbi:12124_t:CDS:2 [Acaulospora colombiana]|uniref:12124_t:CDS:1 n=1 Tax=Acaulospora colombiana TaxID=27376 RepID=A0ACA9L2S6_9GLOM|nr:12124_t:CDS:2 [Acaulospora colombiana]